MAERKVSQKVSFSALTPPDLDEIRRSEEPADSHGSTLLNLFQQPATNSPEERDRKFDPGSGSSSSDSESKSGEENYVGTYVSRYANTISDGTEALPRIDNFRDIYSVHAAKSRPTIDELHGRGSWGDFGEPAVRFL